jgi:hypothetical protein
MVAAPAALIPHRRDIQCAATATGSDVVEGCVNGCLTAVKHMGIEKNVFRKTVLNAVCMHLIRAAAGRKLVERRHKQHWIRIHLLVPTRSLYGSRCPPASARWVSRRHWAGPLRSAAVAAILSVSLQQQAHPGAAQCLECPRGHRPRQSARSRRRRPSWRHRTGPRKSRPQKVNVTVPLTPAQHAKLQKLGGANWILAQIEKARPDSA